MPRASAPAPYTGAESARRRPPGTHAAAAPRTPRPPIEYPRTATPGQPARPRRRGRDRSGRRSGIGPPPLPRLPARRWPRPCRVSPRTGRCRARRAPAATASTPERPHPRPRVQPGRYALGACPLHQHVGDGGLADARLPGQQHDRPTAGTRGGEQLAQLSEDPFAPDDRRLHADHSAWSCSAIGWVAPKPESCWLDRDATPGESGGGWDRG